MRLTQILLRFQPKKPNGHLWRGKHRLYKKVTPLDLANLRLKYEIEERNMFLLRHPYLTIEESSGHAQPFNKKEAWLQKWKDERLKWRDNVTLRDRLGFLKVNEPWD